MHQEELIYKKINLDGSNETDLVRVYPETFDDILIGIARHLFKTGTKKKGTTTGKVQLFAADIKASSDVSPFSITGSRDIDNFRAANVQNTFK